MPKDTNHTEQDMQAAFESWRDRYLIEEYGDDLEGEPAGNFKKEAWQLYKKVILAVVDRSMTNKDAMFCLKKGLMAEQLTIVDAAYYRL